MPISNQIKHFFNPASLRDENSDKPDKTSQAKGSNKSLRQKTGPNPSMTNSGLVNEKSTQLSQKSGTDIRNMKPLAKLASVNYVSGTILAREGNRAELKAMLRDAQLANFPYTRDKQSLPKGYTTNSDLATLGAQLLGLDELADERHSGTLVDPKSGLTASLLVNEKNKEIVIVFGGTTSGKKTGGDLLARSRPGKNFMTTLSQWGANFKAALGGVPKSYKQAADLSEKIQGLTKNQMRDSELNFSNFSGYNLRLIGHSKGGGEAMYASLKQITPITTVTLCPSHLSDGIVKGLPLENVNQAKEKITSYSPYGDPVSALRGLPGISGLGTGYHFAGDTNGNPIDFHDQFLRHVRHFSDPILNSAGRTPLSLPASA